MIRDDLVKTPHSAHDHLLNINTDYTGDTFCEFTAVSHEHVRKILSASPTKSCTLDPIPTWLLKQCLDQLVPVLTLIVNTSLECAEFPQELT